LNAIVFLPLYSVTVAQLIFLHYTHGMTHNRMPIIAAIPNYNMAHGLARLLPMLVTQATMQYTYLTMRRQMIVAPSLRVTAVFSGFQARKILALVVHEI